MRDVEPDFRRNLREAPAAGRHRVSRSVMPGPDVLTGPWVVGFMRPSGATGPAGFPAPAPWRSITAFISVIDTGPGHVRVPSPMTGALPSGGGPRNHHAAAGGR